MGKKTYKLVFDFDAIAEAEELTGRSLITGLTRDMLNSPKINFIRGMFYACAKKHQPELTFESAKNLITLKNYIKVWETVLGAFADAMKSADEGDSEPGEEQGQN